MLLYEIFLKALKNYLASFQDYDVTTDIAITEIAEDGTGECNSCKNSVNKGSAAVGDYCTGLVNTDVSKNGNPLAGFSPRYSPVLKARQTTNSFACIISWNSRKIRERQICLT